MTLRADRALARRIEGAEARLMAALGAEAQRGAAGAEVIVEPLGEGVALFVRKDSPLNKAIGFGLDGPVEAVTLGRLEARFAARGAPLQCELSTLARIEALQQLAARGYAPMGFEHVLGQLPTAAGHPGAHVVERADAGDIEAWIRCMADAFLAADGTGTGSPDGFVRDEVIASMRTMMAVPGVHRYVVRIKGAMAGGASMRVDSAGVAQLCGAATLPRFRRRGVQAALLAARLADARDLGCDVAVITTQPGSTSQANAERQGFGLLYARAILVRPAR